MSAVLSAAPPAPPAHPAVPAEPRVPNAQRHSAVRRGLAAAGTQPHFEGRFGRLFPDLPAATFGLTAEKEHAALAALAAAMVSPFDAPKDAPDDEESAIPALYTYFGQFIDHDLTFGPEGSFQKIRDPDASVDFRTAAFDLDNVYGRGPGDQPYLYAEDGKSFLLGGPLTLGTNAGARDLQRNGAGRALIGDPRNDENAIVSQLQGLFLRFHNRVVAENPALSFEDCQTIVQRHYQHVVLTDFLARIVGRPVLDALRDPHGAFDRTRLRFFRNLARPFIPVEFATAAYRFGHSMIRPGYRLNDATLLPIFPLPAAAVPGFPEGLTGFRSMTQDWGMDWGRLIDIDQRAYGSATPGTDAGLLLANFQRLQFAYRIDTALVDPLGSLPEVVAGNQPFSLALRNLLRGRQFNMPSGQAVAKAMGVVPLTDAQILIGQAVDDAPAPPSITAAVPGFAGAFAGNCPLWTYILAEAAQNRSAPQPLPVKGGAVSVTTPQLGPVGGRIVAEVFVGLMFADPLSILGQGPMWVPPEGAGYRLKDFVGYALGG